MYILIAALVTLFLPMFFNSNFHLEGMDWESVIAIISMGCFILYDNRRKRDKTEKKAEL